MSVQEPRTAGQWAARLAVELTILANWPGDETAEVAKETLAEFRLWQEQQGDQRLARALDLPHLRVVPE